MKTSTKKLTVSAMLVALAVVLSFIKIFDARYGCSVTAGSMVPLILIGCLFGSKQGVLACFVYALIQMLLGFVAPPANTFFAFTAEVLLDYVIAFGVLGLSGTFFKAMGKKAYALPVAGFIVIFCRFICHFLSGILIWGIYAGEGQPVWLYSLTYNGSYMLFEAIISAVILAAVSKPFVKNLDKLNS